MTIASTGRIERWLLLAACAAAMLAYWPGLAGPLLLDDRANLDVLSNYLAGSADWRAVVFGNESGPTGRPLAMLSFLANALTTGDSVWAMKATNLALHLVAGLLLAWLCAMVFDADPRLRARAPVAAAGVAAAWLLLPMHVSTVLYVIQRMALLSSLFTLLALCLYVLARRRSLQAPPRPQRALLWLGVPLATALAVACKESGTLTPLLCALVEFCYFGFRLPPARGNGFLAFWALYLVLPIVAGLALLAWSSDSLLAGYAGRDFTLAERLLTEPRVLWDYVGGILLPRGSALGLFHDDFEVSRGLAAPATTLPALAGWMAVLGLGILAYRRGRSTVLFGITFFLGSHALESTLLPLEIYFEHRNYLAAAGVLITIAGLWEWMADAMPPALRPRAALPAAVLAGVVLACYAMATAALGRSWADEGLLYRHALEAHPDSFRLRMLDANRLIGAREFDAAMAQLDQAERVSAPRAGSVELARLYVECIAGRPIQALRYQRVADLAPRSIGNTELGVFEGLVLNLGDGPCRGVDLAALAAVTGVWLERDASANHGFANWRFRALHALLLARAGQLSPALDEALRAWRDSGYRVERGIFAFQLAATLGEKRTCIAVLAAIRANYRGADPRIHDFLGRAEADIQTMPEPANPPPPRFP